MDPEHVEIDGGWVNRLLAEYRLSSRVPNRKFKVPRDVLADRLRRFWIALFRIRKLILLKFGYLPKMRNLDQSPYHGNEAGSAATNTLTINQTTSSSFQKGLSYSWSFSPSRHFHDLPFTCNKKASVHDTIIICNGHVMQKSST